MRLVHMRQGEIGADEPGRAADEPRADPDRGAARRGRTARTTRPRPPTAMPRSGCLISSATTSAIERDGDPVAGKAGIEPVLREEPGGRRRRSVGLTNSDGWSDRPGSSIQRRAPLISTPTDEGVGEQHQRDDEPDRGDAADAARALQRHDEHGQRAPPAAPRNSAARNADWSAPMRSATAGLAAITMSEPKPISTPMRERGPAVDRPPPLRDGALIGAGEVHAPRSRQALRRGRGTRRRAPRNR